MEDVEKQVGRYDTKVLVQSRAAVDFGFFTYSGSSRAFSVPLLLVSAVNRNQGKC